MTRQNLSQRLRRDNFPEQDMHELAAMLGYQVSVQLTPVSTTETIPVLPAQPVQPVIPRPAYIPAPPQPAYQEVFG